MILAAVTGHIFSNWWCGPNEIRTTLRFADQPAVRHQKDMKGNSKRTSHILKAQCLKEVPKREIPFTFVLELPSMIAYKLPLVA